MGKGRYHPTAPLLCCRRCTGREGRLKDGRVRDLFCTLELLSCIHQNHGKPNTLVKKVVREFDRGTRGWFLRKAVPRHGGGGGVHRASPQEAPGEESRDK